jgi:group II intron reverse transcriptase/maturase
MQGEPEQRAKDARESEDRVRATKPEKGKAPRSDGAKAVRAAEEPREGNAPAAQTADVASTGLSRVAELAKQNPRMRFNSLAHLITVWELRAAAEKLRKDAAVGVDGVTVAQYRENLWENLDALHARMKAGQYRHQPIRRVHIPKENGKQRPIGVSCTEDKVVQQAVRKVLETIYEQDFLECSYGFRPGRRAHDALRAIDAMAMSGKVNWVLEADIQAFFDSLDRKRLMEMVSRRVADGRLLQLVGKCLHVGVLDGAEYAEPEEGTAQGSVISPLLGNVYLHYVLDVWFEEEIRPRLRGKAQLVRYADDFVIGFESMSDAQDVMRALHRQMGENGLTLHPDKTRLVPFVRPRKGWKGKAGGGTFDFLGFTVYWRRTPKGSWVLGMKTRQARIKRALKAVYDFCRSQRHRAVEEQHAGLCSRLRGHFNYFGVNGNYPALVRLVNGARSAWFKWLNRRSQRSRLTWRRFTAMLRTYALPEPSIRVTLWSGAP